MSVVIERDEASKVKGSLSELKAKRRELERQLTGAGAPVSDDTADEGKIKKFLGSFYQSPPSAPTKPNREQLEAEIEALDEAITRLRKTYHDAKGKAEAEQTARLMPEHRQAVAELQAAIDAAVQANEKVLNIERALCFSQTSMAWDQLIHPGGQFRLPISGWRQRVAGFLSSAT